MTIGLDWTPLDRGPDPIYVAKQRVPFEERGRGFSFEHGGGGGGGGGRGWTTTTSAYPGGANSLEELEKVDASE